MDLSRHLKAQGLRGGPIAAKRALDGGGRYRERGRALPKRLPKKPEDDGGNAWRGVFSPALTERLGCDERARLLLLLPLPPVPPGPAAARNVAAPLHATCRAARPHRNHRRRQPCSMTGADRNWTPHDLRAARPSSSPHCFVRVIARPELSSVLEIRDASRTMRIAGQGPPRVRISFAKILGLY